MSKHLDRRINPPCLVREEIVRLGVFLGEHPERSGLGLQLGDLCVRGDGPTGQVGVFDDFRDAVVENPHLRAPAYWRDVRDLREAFDREILGCVSKLVRARRAVLVDDEPFGCASLLRCNRSEHCRGEQCKARHAHASMERQRRVHLHRIPLRTPKLNNC